MSENLVITLSRSGNPIHSFNTLPISNEFQYTESYKSLEQISYSLLPACLGQEGFVIINIIIIIIVVQPGYQCLKCGLIFKHSFLSALVPSKRTLSFHVVSPPTNWRRADALLISLALIHSLFLSPSSTSSFLSHFPFPFPHFFLPPSCSVSSNFQSLPPGRCPFTSNKHALPLPLPPFCHSSFPSCHNHCISQNDTNATSLNGGLRGWDVPLPTWSQPHHL